MDEQDPMREGGPDGGSGGLEAWDGPSDDGGSAGLAGRVATLEGAVATVTEAVTELLDEGAAKEEENKRGRSAPQVRAFDPRAIADPAGRRGAWERLYAFVDYLNATWGALRDGKGYGDYYIRAGWWTSPIIVAHLAALEGEYAEAWVFAAAPGVGTSLMLRAVEHTEAVLERVTGHARPGGSWSQAHMASHGSTWDDGAPPSALGSGVDPAREASRAEDFRRFLDTTDAGASAPASAFFAALKAAAADPAP